MYYIFKPRIDLKAETESIGDFNLSMDLNNVVLETEHELTDEQIEIAKTKVKNLLKLKFKITNITLDILNIIR